MVLNFSPGVSIDDMTFRARKECGTKQEKLIARKVIEPMMRLCAELSAGVRIVLYKTEIEIYS
jgi:hypothetical protein